MWQRSLKHHSFNAGHALKPGWFCMLFSSGGTYWGESGYVRVKMSGVNGAGPCGMYQVRG
jgi:hypothetical protein